MLKQETDSYGIKDTLHKMTSYYLENFKKLSCFLKTYFSVTFHSSVAWLWLRGLTHYTQDQEDSISNSTAPWA